MIFYVILFLAFAYAVGVASYTVLDDGKEKPEGFETDVEHGADGKPLPKTSPLYWFNVVAEGLFSYPAAWLRRLFGLPQK